MFGGGGGGFADAVWSHKNRSVPLQSRGGKNNLILPEPLPYILGNLSKFRRIQTSMFFLSPIY